MKSLYIFFVFLPILCNCQTTTTISYDEARENCRQIAKAANTDPNKLVYTGPECIIGAQIPEFTAYTFTGKEINPEYFKGRISILNFWYVSCPPCIAEIPGLNALIEKYGTDKINYLAIGIDNDEDIKEFLVKHAWKFDFVSNGMPIIIDYFKNGWGFPTTLILDRNAKIIMAFSGGKSDSRAIDEMQTNISAVLDKELY